MYVKWNYIGLTSGQFIKVAQSESIFFTKLVDIDRMELIDHKGIETTLMTTNKKTTHLTIRISPEQLQEVKDFAATLDMSFTDFVIEALNEKMGIENDRDRRLKALEEAVFAATRSAA